MYSGVLDQVAARTPVSVWSIVPNEELWAALGSRYPDLSESHEIPERKIVGRLRDFVDMHRPLALEWSGKESLVDQRRRKVVHTRTSCQRDC